MSGKKWAWAIMLVCLLPTGVRAHEGPSAQPLPSPPPFRGDVIPPVLTSSPAVLRLDIEKKLREVPGQQWQEHLWAERTRVGERGRRRVIPVMLSLLVPGSGEIYMGYYKRGIALVAVEVGAWLGYIHYHRQGLDTRRAYERYADEHWNFDKWLTDHPAGPYPNLDSLEADGRRGSYDKPGFFPEFFYMPFIDKSEDKQHYYENIGKYNWFISGWDDWSPTLDVDLVYQTESTHRTRYRSMRDESNRQLDNANRFIYLSIAARVFSLIETIVLSRPPDKSAGGISIKGLEFELSSRDLYTTRISLGYRFK